MNAIVRKIFIESLHSILCPIVKFCITHSIKYQDFVEVTKRVYVKYAQDEVASRKLEISTSKLSVITGLRRREIDRLLSQDQDLSTDGILNLRLIGQWVSDKRFINKNGRPRSLELEGNDSEFARLVRSVSKDINHRTLLFELERSGSVKRVGTKVRLDTSVYMPRENLRDGFSLLSSDVSDLIAAGNENIFSKNGARNLHAKTVYDNIPLEFESKIREWFLRFGGKIHKAARKYLAQHDKDINKAVAKKAGRLRIVLGTFSYIDPIQIGRKRAAANVVRGK